MLARNLLGVSTVADKKKTDRSYRTIVRSIARHTEPGDLDKVAAKQVLRSAYHSTIV